MVEKPGSTNLALVTVAILGRVPRTRTRLKARQDLDSRGIFATRMKISVTTKLVLTMLLSGAALAVVMALAMRWSFQKGFFDYLSEVEWTSLEPTRESLAEAHRESGSWQFLRGNHTLWASFLPFEQNARADEAENRVPAQGGLEPSGARPLRRPPPGAPPPFPRASFGAAHEEFPAPAHPPEHDFDGPPPPRFAERSFPDPLPAFGRRPPPPMPPEHGFDGPPPAGFAERPFPDPSPAFGRRPPPPAPAEHGFDDRPPPRFAEQPFPDPSPSFGPRPPPPAPNDRTGLSTRIRLLGAEQQRIIGPPDESGQAELRPISVNGETVGWLSLTPAHVPTTDIDRSFLDEQLRALYPIGGGALLLSLLFGVPMGRHLLRPVKAIAGGARRLTMGRYETRLQPQGGDELGQLAQDFNTLAEALQRNERLRRQGMADVSHELRTPLGLLRGEIEAMQDGIRPLNQERLAALHATVMGLSGLVDDLYDLALADAGALSYRKTEVDLAVIVEQAVAAAQSGCAEAGLKLSVHLDGPLAVNADPRRMRQVLDNLLSNSRRYTDRGGEIVVRTGRANGRATIEVEDSAPGVEAAALPKLFQRFFRVEASRNRASGGAGLGLPICHSIVAAHKGTLQAQQSPLGGLRMVVEIPTVG